MPDGFWWDWWVNALAATATFAAVLVALFGEAFRAKFFPPKLSLRLASPGGELTSVRITAPDGSARTESARYFHIQVENARRWSPATELQVVLRQVHVPGPDGELQVEWTGAVPLMWRHQALFPTTRTVGAPADLDLCSVGEGKWLRIHLMLTPFNLAVQRHTATTMVLSLQAHASEADSPVLRLRVSWDGNWHDGETEMMRHLKIAEVPGTAG